LKANPHPAIQAVDIDSVTMLPGRRCPDAAAVAVLAASIQRLGLRTPIWVRHHPNRPSDGADDSILLIAGAHRLAAAKSLGWRKIDAVFVNDDLVNDELWEIAENLHRAELSALERDEQIARWVDLTAMGVSDNLSETPAKGGRPGAAAAAARDLRVNERDVQRAVKVAAIAPEAKQAARDVGLADNRSALLAVAKAETPKAQVAAVKLISKTKAKRRRGPRFEAPVESQHDRDVSMLRGVFDAACDSARLEFLSAEALSPATTPGRGADAICPRVREAVKVLSGLPSAHEVRKYFAGRDDACLISEALEPARAWLDEFAGVWNDAEAE